VLAALVLFAPSGLFAQEVGEATVDDSTRMLRRAIDERDETIQQLMNRIDELEARVEKIEVGSGQEQQVRTETGTIAPEPVDIPIADTEPVDGPIDQGEADVAPKDPTTSTEALKHAELDQEEKDRLVRAAFEQTLIERGGLLLPPRSFDLDPSFSYVHSSSDNILIDGFTVLPVLVIGDIVSQRIRQDQILATMTARLGLPWDSQIEVRVPYSYTKRRTVTADNREETVSDSGLGDVEVALSHQLYKTRGKWPDLLTTVRWKSTTGDSPFRTGSEYSALGTGYHSLNFSLTGVKIVDPLVYFGGFSYSRNFSTNEDIGRFKPGDNLGFNLGTAIALNLNSSLKFSYDQQFALKSELSGETIPGSYLTTGVFSVGITYSFFNAMTVDTSLGIGVTRDSPDVFFNMSFPFRGKF
jgi:hypothetical protein